MVIKRRTCTAGNPGEATGGTAADLAGAAAEGDIGGLAGENGALPPTRKPVVGSVIRRNSITF